MYIPGHFRQHNIGEVKSFLEQNSFGILVSQVNGKPWATHIPLELEVNGEGKEVLVGHISRGNKAMERV
jgi:transcriptional regulator